MRTRRIRATAASACSLIVETGGHQQVWRHATTENMYEFVLILFPFLFLFFFFLFFFEDSRENRGLSRMLNLLMISPTEID